MSRSQLYQTKLDGYFRLRANPAINGSQNGPFLAFEGKDWFPIDVDSGSSTSLVDVEWRAYLRANAVLWAKERNKYHAQGKTVGPKVYECGICWDTLAKPVVPLCILIFCFHCLRKWMAEGRKACLVCHANISEAPMTDDVFETELDAAIGFGVVVKPTGQH
ncbi:hypothetical protein K438DRAFT_2032795 [Mycena galopus ATCC 62051]|nr:hypothetical protein K438DRAFT_2032795 [Mycena galopus ATCC 62051]